MGKRNRARVGGYEFRRWGLAGGLIAAVACVRAAVYRAPPQTEAYFQRVSAAADATPTRFDNWVSVDAPVPPAAITMLKPNVTISKKYTNLQTGQRGTFFLVQCKDAQSLVGHYPPVCYVANGFVQTAAEPQTWTANGLSIHGMIYNFASARPEDLSSMVIYDFMILPDGTTCQDMSGVNAIARDPRTRPLGAAQLQILMDPNLSKEQRDALFLTLVQANRKTIDQILEGVHR